MDGATPEVKHPVKVSDYISWDPLRPVLRQVALDCGVLDRVTIHAKRMRAIDNFSLVGVPVQRAECCQHAGRDRAAHRAPADADRRRAEGPWAFPQPLRIL